MSERKQKPFFFPEDIGLDTSTLFTRATRGVKQGKVHDCSNCGLCETTIKSPKMSMVGKGKKSILIIGQNPGKEEDRLGIPFVGNSGLMLQRLLSMLGINLNEDCYRTNVVQCYAGCDKWGKDKDPTPKQIQCCRQRLLKDIEEAKPKLIIPLGGVAVSALMKEIKIKTKLSISLLHGIPLPVHKYNAWVCSAYHPSYFLHKEKNPKFVYDENILLFDLATALGYLNKPLPKPFTPDGNILISDPDEAIRILKEYSESNKPTAIDYETNCLSAYNKDAKVYSLQLSNDVDKAHYIPLYINNPETGKPFFDLVSLSHVWQAITDFLKSNTPKVIQNYNMEETWSRVHFGTSINNYIHDTMIGSHVQFNRRGATGLAFQAFRNTGHIYKSSIDVTDMQNEKFEDVVNYACFDPRHTLLSYQKQTAFFDKTGRLHDFYQLLHRGSKALATLKHRGVDIDVGFMDGMKEEYQKKQEDCLNQIKRCSEVAKWESENVDVFNPDSPKQLVKVIYDQFQAPRKSKSNKGATEEKALKEIVTKTTNSELKKFIGNILAFRKTCSLLERVENYHTLIDPNFLVHPDYWLNVAKTYRSASSNPNIQNLFKHDKELMRFRKCVVPPPGYVFMEVDYGALEMCVSAMVSGDTVLAQQIIDHVNIHRKWAALLYEKDEKDITPDERYLAKNRFVFASIYNSLPESIAYNYPEISKERIIEVQKIFWQEYQGVKEWQNRNVTNYLSKGYIELVTGARCYGPLSINDLSNYGIQGPAFHLLLDGLSRIEEDLVGKEFPEKNIIMLPRIEVHDSITSIIKIEDIPIAMPRINDILTSKRFDWQGNVPLTAEFEVGRNWYELGGLEIKSCISCGKDTAHRKYVEEIDKKKVKKVECMCCGKKQ